MKIAVCILSRGNPMGLICAIRALDALASGQHEIRYIVRCAPSEANYLQPVTVWSGRRLTWFNEHPGDLSRGVSWNELLDVPVLSDPDAFCFLTDRVFPTALGWDHAIDQMINVRGFDAFSWRDLTDPMHITYPVLSRNWIKAAGQVMPDDLPSEILGFWLKEVYHLAKGSPMAICADLTLGGKAPDNDEALDVPKVAARVAELQTGAAEQIREKLEFLSVVQSGTPGVTLNDGVKLGDSHAA